jgi:hypothetical protein
MNLIPPISIKFLKKHIKNDESLCFKEQIASVSIYLVFYHSFFKNYASPFANSWKINSWENGLFTNNGRHLAVKSLKLPQAELYFSAGGITFNHKSSNKSLQTALTVKTVVKSQRVNVYLYIRPAMMAKNCRKVSIILKIVTEKFTMENLKWQIYCKFSD